MNYLKYAIYFILIVFASFSCGRKEYTEAGINEIVEETNVILETAKPVQFDWGSKSAYSNFRGYFSGDQLIFINEDYRYRSPAESFNRYYYKDGNLIHFIGKKLAYREESDGKMYKDYTDLVMNTDPSGNVISYNKIKNKQRVALEDDELEEILTHAKELNDIVENRKQKSEVTHRDKE